MCRINFDGKLRPGEKAVVMALACDRHQAAILFNYVRGYFEAIPALKAMVTAIGSVCIELCNDVVVEVHTNSFRAVRGRSLLCVVMDECARDENFASPDVEVHAAVSPGLARVPSSMLILISSVHKRSGLLYQRYRDYYGVAPVIRRHLQRELYGQGIGRHTESEVFNLGKKDLTSLSDFLGDKPFFMGEQPTILDATAFGFLVNVLWCPIESPLKEHAKQLENLLEFCNRMKRRFFAAA